jgi:hypothetical protein
MRIDGRLSRSAETFEGQSQSVYDLARALSFSKAGGCAGSGARLEVRWMGEGNLQSRGALVVTLVATLSAGRNPTDNHRDRYKRCLSRDSRIYSSENKKSWAV